jgi:hypothetical protein
MAILLKSGLRSEPARRCGALRNIKPGACGLFNTFNTCSQRRFSSEGRGYHSMLRRILRSKWTARFNYGGMLVWGGLFYAAFISPKKTQQNGSGREKKKTITFPSCDGKELSVDGVVSREGNFRSVPPSCFRKLFCWEQNHCCEYHGGTENNKPHGEVCSLFVADEFKFKGRFSNGQFNNVGCLSLHGTNRSTTDSKYLMSAIGYWKQGSLLYGVILNDDGNAVAYVNDSIVHGCDGKVLFGADHPDISNYSVIVKTATAYAIEHNTKPLGPMPQMDLFKHIEDEKIRRYSEMQMEDFVLVMNYVYSNHFKVKYIAFVYHKVDYLLLTHVVVFVRE